MAVIGGPVESVSINGRTFGVPADSDVKIFLGGDSNTVEANGDGATARILKEIKPLKVSGLTVSIDDANDDHQFLQSIIDGFKFVDISITKPNGDVYSGQGMITGDLETSVKTATAELEISGPGKLTKQ
jgi:hypothetical protein